MVNQCKQTLNLKFFPSTPNQSKQTFNLSSFIYTYTTETWITTKTQQQNYNCLSKEVIHNYCTNKSMHVVSVYIYLTFASNNITEHDAGFSVAQNCCFNLIKLTSDMPFLSKNSPVCEIPWGYDLFYSAGFQKKMIINYIFIEI